MALEDHEISVSDQGCSCLTSDSVITRASLVFVIWNVRSAKICRKAVKLLALEQKRRDKVRSGHNRRNMDELSWA